MTKTPRPRWLAATLDGGFQPIGIFAKFSDAKRATGFERRRSWAWANGAQTVADCGSQGEIDAVVWREDADAELARTHGL